MLFTSTTASTALLSCLSLTNALTIPEKRQSSSGLIVYTSDGWSSLGCWSDSQSNRTLSVAKYFGEYVSDDDCQYKCDQVGYKYAGTEYAGQCFCGDNINPVATQKPDGDCNMACTGQPTQACGGPDRINIFKKNSGGPAPTVYTNPGVDGYVFEGCYSDATNARTLGHSVTTAGGKYAMTVKLCVDACANAGYSLAGAEYGGECYCDNTYSHGSLATDQSSCSMTCNGNKTEHCGGTGFMNMYSNAGAAPVAAAPQSLPPAVTPTLPAGWTTLGCYTDTNGKRTLSNYYTSPSGNMTVETCVGLCSNAGYKIAGVEYGGECFCDNTVRNAHGLAPDGDAGCNMRCNGNQGETCGGSDHLNVYASGPTWVQLGCFTDQVYKRTLANTGTVSGDMTVEKCQASCKASGFPYAGVEYGNECYCGSSFDNGGAQASDGFAGCTFACQGDSTEICGGNQRLSMYEFINADGSVGSSPSATQAQ